MKTKLLLIIATVLLACPLLAKTTKYETIAILGTVDINQAYQRGDLLVVRNTIANVLRTVGELKVLDRKDISSILDEHEFQRTGLVDDSKVKEIGKMLGADLVLYTEIAPRASGVYIYGKAMDVETAEWVLFGDATAENIYKIDPALNQLVRNMLSGKNGQQGSPSNTSLSFSNYSGDYVEEVLDLDMKMVWVEGGSFQMGSEDSDAYADENPVHHVTIDSYYIAETEVTQAQWEAVMGTTIQNQASKAGETDFYGVESNYPMYYVSWDDAQKFCRRLSRMTGRKYRLPTEAQWEYAARGGKNDVGYKYSGSNSIDNVAWYNGNSGYSTHPVKTKDYNSLGLYDMSGNVLEWCRDWFGDYDANDTNNPTGPSSGSDRVLRGGSWLTGARNCRVSYRNYYTPGDRYYFSGFRVVAVP